MQQTLQSIKGWYVRWKEEKNSKPKYQYHSLYRTFNAMHWTVGEKYVAMSSLNEETEGGEENSE